ncbi:hypothetical protein ABT294_25825 [Nonomuraea sp. NPDC000554]|uniref:hypothetical protein n=1 Tax=Nonomuraea sp. NPDC000554 TaxID=3154259 RepID=UPI003330526E
MIDYRQKHTADWLQYFAYRAARPLAAGVKCAVYWLDEGVVAKVHQSGRDLPAGD